MQPHVHAVYAFARHADDLADEGYAGAADGSDVMTRDERLAALGRVGAAVAVSS